MSLMTWAPLPPRRGRKRVLPLATADDATSFQDRAAANAATVAANVAERGAAKRAKPMGVSEHKGQNYEHLDHTADVQFHAWGDSLEAAVSSLGDCFFDYVTDRSKIAEDESCAQTFQVSAADGPAFIFRFLDELLFRFSADNIACATVKVDALVCTEGSWSATVSSTGERFDLSKHPQGCEVKAITYSNMQIHQDKGRHDLFVIVDI